MADPPLSADIAAFAAYWGKWFIRLSFAGALLSLVLAAVAAWRGPKVARGDQPSDIIKALTALLEALAKLPAWVAIYLAGFALFWLALR